MPIGSSTTEWMGHQLREQKEHVAQYTKSIAYQDVTWIPQILKNGQVDVIEMSLLFACLPGTVWHTTQHLRETPRSFVFKREAKGQKIVQKMTDLPLTRTHNSDWVRTHKTEETTIVMWVGSQVKNHHFCGLPSFECFSGRSLKSIW